MLVHNHIEIDEEKLAAICRRYHVRELALFGSILRNDFRDDSDIDVLVEFEPDARIGFIALQDFNEELESFLGRPVDVVTRNGLNRFLREPVLSSARVVYATG
ncbi:nucleotidyltransferase [soil metagenome]